MEATDGGGGRPGPASVGGAVARDVGALFAARALGAGANFAVLILLVHRVPAAEVGLYYVLVNLWNILNVLIDFGGDPIATREIARDPAREGAILRDFLTAKAWLAALGGVLFVATVLWLVDGAAYRTSFLLTLVVLPGFYFGSFSVVFRVRHRMRRPALALGAGQLLFFAGSVAGLCLLEAGPGRFRALALAYAAGILCGGLLIFRFARRHAPRLASGQGGARFLGECWPQGVAALAGILYFYLDTLMLKGLVGDAEAGYYNAAYRLLNFVIYLAGVVGISVLPILARERRQNRARLKVIYRDTLTALWGLAIWIAAVGGALAPELMRFLYRERMASYGVAVPTLQILLAASVFAFGGALASISLVALGRQRLWTLAALGGLVVNVGLNLWLIPLRGHIGAAWATLATEGLVTAACLVLVHRVEGLRPDGAAAAKLLLLGAATFAASAALRTLPFPVAAAASSAVFLGGAALLGLLPRRLFRLSLGRLDEPPDRS
ncbi:MAG: flippase [Planctomycetes bacterium]|nr:flippase [Planctomycetota bacterium]